MTAGGERFVVASAAGNAALAGGAKFGSEAEARAHMAGLLHAEASLVGCVQVLSAFEVAA